MKFTNEDLMKAMGLQVGDRIKVADKVYTIIKLDDNYFLEDISLTPVLKINHWQSITTLLNQDIEILPRQKRVGDLKCGEYGEQNCNSCPIRAICVSDEYNNDTLYEKLELSHKYAKDQEIYDLLKARLDKEVVK